MDTATVNEIAREISALLRRLPATDSDATVRADWLDRKAAVLEWIAVEDRGLHLDASEWAAEARAKARQLRAAVE